MNSKLNIILKKAQKGERPAQHQLYQAFAPRVYGICLRYAKDKHEANDMAQNAWIQVFTKLTSFSNKGSFEGWLHRLIVNCCLQHLRSQKGTLTDSFTHEDGELKQLPNQLTVKSDAITNLSAQDLLKLVQKLPVGFRAVFNLVAIEGFSHAEAANILEISESTSRSQLTRARTKLQAYLIKNSMLCL